MVANVSKKVHFMRLSCYIACSIISHHFIMCLCQVPRTVYDIVPFSNRTLYHVPVYDTASIDIAALLPAHASPSQLRIRVSEIPLVNLHLHLPVGYPSRDLPVVEIRAPGLGQKARNKLAEGNLSVRIHRTVGGFREYHRHH